MEDYPKPHALCLPFPLQSHIKAMLKLSKLLHNKGFQITFVNTEFNQRRLLKATSFDPDSLRALGFRFDTIADGLPPSDPDATQDIPALCISTRTNFTRPLRELVKRINDNARAEQNGVVSSDRLRPVSCLVVDGFMSLAVDSTAPEFDIPIVKFFPVSANAVVGFQQFSTLLEKQIIPLTDESNLSSIENTILDWVPGMKGARVQDLPSFWRTKDRNDTMLNFCIDEIKTAHESSAVVVQTFDVFERDALEDLSTKVPRLYGIGPLELILKKSLKNDPLEAIPYSLWEEEAECLKWLDEQKPDSVIYINFGSVMVLTPQQLADIGWGLANSGQTFLWVIRPDLVMGNSACLPKEFLDEIRERSLIISWCPQEDVLNHSSIGGFLTHCGWNSIVESMTSGVPLLCYPFFADQQTNCWHACNGLGVGIEIDKDVKRDQVEELVRDLIIGEKGKTMRKKALEWKRLAEEATSPNGTSIKNLDDLVEQVLLAPRV